LTILNSAVNCLDIRVHYTLHDQIFKQLEIDLNAEPNIVSMESFHSYDSNIWKLIIPNQNQSELYRFISSCNIRSYTLFPGLDGLAKSLQEMMRAFD
ncbi:MAG: hypothetical protein WCI11_16295, partial [Candidatus Methylumidiphilus sp.]